MLDRFERGSTFIGRVFGRLLIFVMLPFGFFFHAFAPDLVLSGNGYKVLVSISLALILLVSIYTVELSLKYPGKLKIWPMIIR